MNKPIYISIGSNCNPRIFIKNKLNLSKYNGYLSCPFDLCQTPYVALCNCIKDDFAMFFVNLRLIEGVNAGGNRMKSGKGKLNITNYYNIVFNHESSTHSHLFSKGTNDDEYYTRNNFKLFKERYETRISNFRNYINNNNIINLVFFNESKVDLNIILLILKNKYINKNFNIIYVG